MPKLLGIDYGTKRIGLAWADELKISLPLESIPGVELDGCWDAMTRVVNERGVQELIVGYPVHMDGKIGRRAGEVDQFIAKLQSTFNLPVHRVDERLTSVAALESIMKKGNRKKGRVRPDGRVDATAASLILRDFLNQGGQGGV
jgi:putative Holliday junction resolvase|tara:strand:- start:74 stop:505 length:432 start_codon:yes stop_codon:yes gene_type:complete